MYSDKISVSICLAYSNSQPRHNMKMHRLDISLYVYDQLNKFIISNLENLVKRNLKCEFNTLINSKLKMGYIMLPIIKHITKHAVTRNMSYIFLEILKQ